jgi:hypothetical protein
MEYYTMLMYISYYMYGCGGGEQAEFQSYFKTMPWVALPLASTRKAALSSMFGVSGIPM